VLSRLSLWLALLALVAGAGLLFQKAWIDTETLVFPLDDAYIHLAVARTLAETGSWGVNPGQFASASSSPLWTMLLALCWPVAQYWPEGALAGLNLLSSVLLLGLAWSSLKEHSPFQQAILLLLLVILVPLPFLVALGMEHTLQAALALGLLLSVERSKSAGFLFFLAAATSLIRYEGVALVGLLALFGKQDIQKRVALLVGSGGAVLAFGFFCMLQGGAFLPNSILKKANYGQLDGFIAAFTECPSLVALCIAGLGLLFVERRRGFLLLGLILSQAALGRVGWLYRYEAWLVVLGVLFVGRVALARPVFWIFLLPLFSRAALAWEAYAPGVQFAAAANVAVGKWLSERTVAVHDLGAAAFYGKGKVVDLSGLGTEALAKSIREKTLTAEALNRYLREEQVDLAVTGSSWPGGIKPEQARAVGRLFVPYPAGHGEFELIFWALGGVGVELPQRWPGGRWLGPEEVVLEECGVEGEAVDFEEGGVSFYSNGRLECVAAASGDLVVVAYGTEAKGERAVLRVQLGEEESSVSVGSEGSSYVFGRVGEGEKVVLEFVNDWMEDGEDRNLFVRRLQSRREAENAEDAENSEEP
jgi:hypothetical protein